MLTGKDIKLEYSSTIVQAIKFLIFHATPKIADDYQFRVMSDCPDLNKDENSEPNPSTPKGKPCTDCLYHEDLYNKYQEEVGQHELACAIVGNLNQYL